MPYIDGKKISERIVKTLMQQERPHKFLAAFLVGEEPASISFLKQKATVAAKLGIDFRLMRLSEKSTLDEFRASISAVASQEQCGGIIVQLPLPEKLEKEDVATIMNVLPIEKDVDVLGERSLRLFQQRNYIVMPPAAGVVIKVLAGEYSMFAELLEKEVAVIGVGPLVGAPIITLLEGKTKTLTKLRRGSDFSLLSNADLIITGAGTPGLVKPEMLKSGAGVIDFGYGRQNGKLCGDLDVNNINELGKLSFYTPTPGGTGPVLVAQLFENFYKLNGIKVPD